MNERKRGDGDSQKILELVARLLVLGGAVLLFAGGLLGYPYIHSRLIPSPATLVATVNTDAPRRPSVAGRSDDENPTAQLPTVPSDAPEAHPEISATAIPALAVPTEPRTLEHTTREARVAPPTRIVIPQLGVDAAVVPVSSHVKEVEDQTIVVWDVPDERAAGWHRTSAAPGERGNMVLNGHNTTYGEVFRDLYSLRKGDEIIITSHQGARTYAVSEALIVSEAGQPIEVRLANARYVMPTDDERLTLVTCHPYGSVRKRLIVVARPSRTGVPRGLPEN